MKTIEISEISKKESKFPSHVLFKVLDERQGEAAQASNFLQRGLKRLVYVLLMEIDIRLREKLKNTTQTQETLDRIRSEVRKLARLAAICMILL